MSVFQFPVDPDPCPVDIPLAHGERVVFASDIEGNYSYWRNFVSSSGAFVIDSGAGNDDGAMFSCNLSLADNFKFVYIGDVVDRGDGDCRLLFDLVSLKERYPDRVHFILGNRDNNKLRLRAELDPEIVAHEYGSSVRWGNGVAGPWKNRTQKLNWILGSTMGSPDSFAHRKAELALLMVSKIVLVSFFFSCRENLYICYFSFIISEQTCRRGLGRGGCGVLYGSSFS